MSYNSVSYAFPFEREAEGKGYVVMSTYDTREEIDAVLRQLHNCGVHAFKAHHGSALLQYDQWWLWVQTKDFDKLASIDPKK